MSARLVLFCLVAAGSVALAADSSSHHRLHFGGVYIGAGYSYFPGGFPYWYDDPLFFPPVYAYGYSTGFAYGPTLGAVRIQGAGKDALVYLDGALAGRAGKLKEMWLDPGAYNLELRTGNRTLTQKIYVLTGRTLKVTPDLMEVKP